MKLRLNSLELTNFKAIGNFKFAPEGKNAIIRADNRKGKTSVADGFRYLLFDKNVKGETKFAIQPLDKDGAKIHHLETVFEGVITIDGTAVTLKKLYKETWLKKKKLHTGYTTEYWIDGTPVQKKKWDSRMADLIDEEIFKVVTLPGYFCSKNLKDKENKTKPSWMVRRDILFDLPPHKLTDGDIIDSDPKLRKLPEILGARSTDEHKAAVKESIKLAKESRDEIKPGIKELTGQLPTEDIDRLPIEAYIKLLDQRIQTAKDDTGLATLRKQLADAQVKLAEAKAEKRQKTDKANEATEAKTFNLKQKIRGLKREIGNAKGDSAVWEDNIKKNNETMAGLRTKFVKEAAKPLQYDEICGLCNQPLPENMIKNAKHKFNAHRAELLLGINLEGKKHKEKNEALQSVINETTHDMNNWKQKCHNLEKDLEKLEAEKNEVKAEIPINITNLALAVVSLQQKIEETPQTDTTELEAVRRREMEKIATLDAAEKSKARIEELGQEEKDLAATIEDLESQLALMNRFIVTKSHALEDEINAQFGFVKWKLFNILVNGEVEECCVPMVDGSTELSNSEEINVGLDSIKTLSKHYNFWAPVWIDEAQSVTAPLEIPSQTIKLVVDAAYPEMEVEYG